LEPAAQNKAEDGKEWFVALQWMPHGAEEEVHQRTTGKENWIKG